MWKWPEKNLGQFARACCYLLFNSNLKFKFFLRQNTRHIINLITRSQKSWENSKKIYWDSCERFKKKLTCFSKAIETLFVQPSFVEALVVVLKQSIKKVDTNKKRTKWSFIINFLSSRCRRGKRLSKVEASSQPCTYF